ncbi:hypothetical protein CEXT_87871, partial [Caerostris extrusa]
LVAEIDVLEAIKDRILHSSMLFGGEMHQDPSSNTKCDTVTLARKRGILRSDFNSTFIHKRNKRKKSKRKKEFPVLSLIRPLSLPFPPFIYSFRQGVRVIELNGGG